VKLEEVREVAEREFDLTIAHLSELGGNEDLNFLATTPEGARYVLKASATCRSALEAQTAVLSFLSGAVATFDVPSARLATDGASVVEVGGTHPFVRVLSFVPGAMSVGSRRPVPGVGAALGAVSGEMVAQLATFSHPGLVEGGDWDLREAQRVVGDDAALSYALAESVERTARFTLPVQVIHGDLTEDNVALGVESGFAGVIDFGDLAPGWAVAELAITLTSLLAHDGPVMGEVLEAVAAFHARRPLSLDEARAVWPLVVRRALVLEAGAARVLGADPHNAYALARRPFERLVLARALAVPYDEAELLILDAVGMLSQVDPHLLPMISGLADAPVLDLSVTSPINDNGAWLDPAPREIAPHCVTEYAAPTLVPEAATGVVPRSVPLAMMAVVEPGRTVVSPANALVRDVRGDGVVLAFVDGGWLRVAGVSALVEAGQTLAAGEVIGSATGSVWVQLCASAIRPPSHVAPGLEAHWARICPDPSVLLGRKPATASGRNTDELLDARDRVLANVQEHYYVAPPRFERGWRHHLIDSDGRGYLDMVNNVAILGHGEPRIAHAVERQLRLLNTNSRFNYEAIVDFSEALLRRCPGLDQVLLVNSGSEAVDLAIRMARAATGRSDVLALTEAYHGWTVGADAISTSLGDNPRALETRPEWVHLLDSPNTYRGAWRDADAGRYAEQAVARIESLADRVALAGLVCEPIFGNGGGMLLPEGYLASVYAAVRAAGGVCVSDEVQVGYGRLGAHFWGFEQQRVVPDIIVMAKAMGNGHPLGAVVTTRAIADAFAAEGSFFSSAGGSPVSCVVGSTVLAVLDEDGLQENALVVGELLASGLRELALRHPRLGAVHGMGLYLGVEVIVGPESPDADGAREICDALLDEGVIVQPTGDHKSVLKIKPPLTLDEAAVGRFLAALDHVLTMADARSRL